jgi:hypothetical protein
LLFFPFFPFWDSFAAHANALYYIKDRYLRLYELGTSKDTPVMSIRKSVVALHILAARLSPGLQAQLDGAKLDGPAVKHPHAGLQPARKRRAAGLGSL